MRTTLATLSLIALLVSPLRAQHDHARSPYADLETVEGTVLSAEEVARLRAGEGMGLALPAELNGYPGPRHVLEHAQGLDLTTEQVSRIERVRDEMSAEARALGEDVIRAERALAALFRDSRATAGAVAEATRGVALVRGRLQAAHLRAHLETTSILTAEQIRRYDELRGYRTGSG
jgi:Spy/CpxP family protein refolding chaperone